MHRRYVPRRGDPLPGGVSDVRTLAGRAVEVRAGAVVHLSGTLL